MLRMVSRMRLIGQGDSPLVDELYRQFAKSYHIDGRRETSATEVAKAVGIENDIIASQNDLALDAAIEDEMNYALSFTGNDVGVPIVVVEDNAGVFGFFGPILHRLPDVDHSLKLFNALLDLSQIECFSELKRSRSSVDVGKALV